MELFLAKMTFWHWFALALILGILDVVLGANFFFVWCGLSAVVVGLLKWMIPNLLWQYQWLIFGIGILTSLFIWRHYLKKPLQMTDQPTLNRRAQQYVGSLCTLEEAIINGRGKVRLGDTVWAVEGEDLPKGARVKVIEVNGTILKVEKV